MIVVVIPVGTDAPVYHWPYATLGLIVFNSVVSVFVWPIMWGGDAVSDESLDLLASVVLQFGHFNPLQWLTWNYIHGGPFHLIANMIVLWPFGLIVEGKIGWWKFLLLYNLIGMLEGAVVQTLMLFVDEGQALGASGAIFGLIAISLMWAPMNEMQCVLFYWICMLVRTFSFECTVLTFSGYALFIQIAVAMVQIMFAAGREEGGMLALMSSEFLHVVGAAAGVAVGIGMLRMKWVDCENFDVFSVSQGRNTMTKEDLKAEFVASPEGQALEAQKRQQALIDFRQHLTANQPLAAAAAYRHAHNRFPDWRLPDEDYLAMLTLLRTLRLYDQAVPLMVDYLRNYTQRTVAVRLALAQLLIDNLQRPGQALRVLAKLNGHALDATQQRVLEALEAKATHAYDEDPYEVAPEDW